MAKNKAPRTRPQSEEEVWFKKRRKLNRKRAKIAKKARKRNRG